MNFHPLLQHLIDSRTLCQMTRYQTRAQKQIRRSVAEHTYSVAKISQMLAQVEINLGNKVDIADLLQRAINHDVIESHTGDIPSMTKDVTPYIRKAIEEVEEEVFENKIKEQLPEGWVELYKKHMLNPKDKSMEGKILEGADNIDAILEALEDIEIGNKSKIMYEIIERSVKKLKNLHLESIDMFLDCIKYILK